MLLTFNFGFQPNILLRLCDFPLNATFLKQSRVVLFRDKHNAVITYFLQSPQHNYNGTGDKFSNFKEMTFLSDNVFDENTYKISLE